MLSIGTGHSEKQTRLWEQTISARRETTTIIAKTGDLRGSARVTYRKPGICGDLLASHTGNRGSAGICFAQAYTG